MHGVRQGSEGEVGGGASTKETPPPSRVSSEGGWRGCVDREPLRLAIRAREGLVVAWWRVDRRNPPPSRVSSEGGVDGVCRQKKPPLRLAFRAREGLAWWHVDRRNTPSVSRFERGRGVLTERTPPSRNSSEGGVGGGMVACRQKKFPLRLAFRAREGWMGCVVKRNPPSVSRFERGRGWWRGGMSAEETPPPSRVSSEGGVC